jgi:hypothetical protein
MIPCAAASFFADALSLDTSSHTTDSSSQRQDFTLYSTGMRVHVSTIFITITNIGAHGA